MTQQGKSESLNNKIAPIDQDDSLVMGLEIEWFLLIIFGIVCLILFFIKVCYMCDCCEKKKYNLPLDMHNHQKIRRDANNSSGRLTASPVGHDFIYVKPKDSKM